MIFLDGPGLWVARGLEHDLTAGFQAGADQVLDDLLLAVHHDDPPAGQLGQRDPVIGAVECQTDAVMDQPFIVHPLAQTAFAQQIDRALLQHAGTHAMLDIFPAAVLQDDRVDTPQVQQMGQEQPGRAGTDDAYLGTHKFSSSSNLEATPLRPFPLEGEGWDGGGYILIVGIRPHP